MQPNRTNSLICSVFLMLATAGPLQCQRLEPPVQCGWLYYTTFKENGLEDCELNHVKISLQQP